MSWENRWEEAEGALCGIAQKAMEYNTHGVEIQFLNSQLRQTGIRVSMVYIYILWLSTHGLQDVKCAQGVFDVVNPSSELVFDLISHYWLTLLWCERRYTYWEKIMGNSGDPFVLPGCCPSKRSK
jgi:hypothetical protein